MLPQGLAGSVAASRSISDCVGRVGAEGAKQFDGGGLSELRAAESGDEIAAADAALGFERFEDFVDGARIRREDFPGRRFRG